MPSYKAPVKDMQFLLHDVLKVPSTGIPGYADLDRDFTAAILDWGARTAAAGAVRKTGALGPVAAFGVAALTDGCADAGLREVAPVG